MASASSIPIQISLLPSPLRLVSIPSGSLAQHTYPLLRLLLSHHRSPPKPSSSSSDDQERFFNVTRNAVEVSLFADEALVRSSFPEAYERAERKEKAPEGEAECSWDAWVSLQVEQQATNEDDWESAGARVKELAHPLAAIGISILFLSTYQTDYLMVKQHELQRVFSRLAGVGFSFNAPPDDLLSPASEISRSLSITSPALAKLQDETGPPSPFALPNPAMDGPPGSGSRTRRPAPPGRIRSSTAVSSNFSGSTGSPSRTGMGGSVSLSGSIVLSDRGSTSSTPGTPSRADRAEGVTMSRTGTQEIPALAGSNGSILPEEDLKRGRTRSRATAPILEGETFEAPVVVPSVRDSPSAASSKSSDSSMEDALLKAITILPDELICVGLDLAYETSWMTAITKLLLFPGDLESAEEPDEEVDEVDAQEVPKWAGDKSIEATGGSTFTIRDSIVGSLSRRGSTTTAPPPPKGFVSLTQTSAEASLTADLGLLRTLFAEDEDNVVLTVGKGGLRGRWMGESEGEEDWEDAVEQGRTLRSCLQLDLSNDSSFGLDRHGVVDMLSDRLLSESIPLLYTSTFKTANVLVATSDLHRARRTLEDRTAALSL